MTSRFDEPIALVVDVGGTKIAVGLIDGAGTMIHSEAGPTGGRGTDASDPAWQTLAGLLDRALGTVGDRRLAGIGVGCAGPIDPVRGTVSPVNIPAWRDFPLVDWVAELVPGVPVHLAGDGACAAAGEHWQGVAHSSDDVLVIVVSTGVGGGLLLDGKLFAGRTGNAGHIGHVVVDTAGDPCPCGGFGCVEAIASGPAMTRWARRNGWRAGDDGATAVDLATDARRDDTIALEAFRRAGTALAAGIVSTAALCDLSHCVIGGGVSAAADLLLAPLEAAYRRHARLGFLRQMRFDTAQLGSSAGLVGAAALVFQPDRYGGTGVHRRPAHHPT